MVIRLSTLLVSDLCCAISGVNFCGRIKIAIKLADDSRIIIFIVFSRNTIWVKFIFLFEVCCFCF